MVCVGVPHLVDVHDVELDQEGVEVGADVVGDHETGELVNVEVLVCEDGGVRLVSASKETPEDVSPNRRSYVAKVVGAQGDAKEDH